MMVWLNRLYYYLNQKFQLYTINNHFFVTKYKLVEYQIPAIDEVLAITEGIISTVIGLMYTLRIVLLQTKANCLISLESFS